MHAATMDPQNSATVALNPQNIVAVHPHSPATCNSTAATLDPFINSTNSISNPSSTPGQSIHATSPTSTSGQSINVTNPTLTLGHCTHTTSPSSKHGHATHEPNQH
eukprot:TRINITY_DN12391_c1_g1_i1.p1 TRINITY_DN12391_c1_g1~~TRINITY_DN12391_c1_g1_i1.p1  ORF type:complete len:106 (-),score=19.21 TRINITY_DN12391_c1_g1_i1:548-865(-)